MIKLTKLKLPIVIIFLTILSAILLFSCKKDAYYTVTFKTDFETVFITQRVLKGETVKPPNNPSKEDFSFVAWYLEENIYDFSLQVNSNITLIARWDKISTKYSVLFLDYDGFVFKNCLIEDGKLVDKPENPLKQGYKFLFWSLNGEEFDFSSPITDDLTLISVWEKDEIQTYSVTFITGSNDVIEKQQVKDGNLVVEPKEPQKDGFKFDGWYLNGERFDFTTPISDNVELLASWIKETVYHTVQFFCDGVVVDSKQIEDSKTVDFINLEDFSNKEFVCWLLDGEEYDFSLPVIKDIDLVAKWKDIEKSKFSVRFILQNGEPDLSFEIEENEYVKEPIAPIREGYIFNGWYLGEDEYDFSLPITGELTLVAKWLEKEKPVEFLGEWKGVENYEGITYLLELTVLENGHHTLFLTDELGVFTSQYTVNEIFVAGDRLYVSIAFGNTDKLLKFDFCCGKLVSSIGVLGGEITFEKLE